MIMINLELERNEEGYYILDDESLKAFEKTHNVNQYSGDIDDNFWITKGDTKVLVKTSDDDSIMFSIYAEMLFSQFAEMNGIPCAEIDVALYNGRPVLLSKNVQSEDSELITYSGLERLTGQNFNSHTAKEIAQSTKEHLDLLRENFGANVILTKNFYNNMLAMLTVDYLTCQGDRHPGNVLFEISSGDPTKELNVCPMFDNEAVFGMMEVKAFYQDYKEYFDSIFSGKNKDVDGFMKFFKEKIQESFIDVRPQMGIDTSVLYCDHEKLQDVMPEYGDGQFAKYANKIVCNDLVMIAKKSEKFSEFCANLSFNASDFAEIIKMETQGFEIPPQFVMLAQVLYNEKRNELQKTMKKVTGKELGE